MPIVLAIEPDRRQAAHLKAIVRQQVGAELLLADTTEGALDAIGNLVPDLVLVPALLSPQDDAALAAALRVIAAAAHVRTLTIPVLGSGTKPAAARGVLARWRRNREESVEPEGCDPAVFGEQISTYLREAAEERAQLEADLLEQQTYMEATPPPMQTALAIVERAPVVPNIVAPASIELDFVESASIEPDVVEAAPIATDIVEPVSIEPDFAGPASVEPDVVQPVQPWAADASDEEPSELEEPVIDLSEELANLADEDGDLDADGELFDGEPVGVYTIAIEPDEPTVEAFDLVAPAHELDRVEDPPVELVELVSAPVLDVAPLLDLAPVEIDFEEPLEAPRADLEKWEPMYLSPGRLWPALEGMPAESPAPRTEQPDWIELVASLRQDLERRGTRPSDGASAQTRPLIRKSRPQPKKAKPVQDEWGFFDPEQCGFSTLLAKLEEITEETPGARA